MTRNSNRKTRVRAVMAAQPNLNFSEAARHVDFTATDEVLAALAPSPIVALAGALNSAGWHRDAARLAEHLAWQPEPDPEADRLRKAADVAAKAADTAPDRRREALQQASNDAGNALSDHLDRGGDPYDDEMLLVRAAVTGLRCAATLADGTAVAAAVADLLDTLRLDFTADAIRYHADVGPIAAPARTESARRANAALHALATAAATPANRDQDWLECIAHLEEARKLARAAADVDRTANTDARLRELVLAHLKTVGVSDAEQQAADFVERVRTGRANTPPDNDAMLWSATSLALDTSLPSDRREIVARQVIAILRRVREPHRRTWGPGDKLPSPPPAKMADIDWAVWMHQKAGNGCYRMSSADRRKYGAGTDEYEGVRVWPFLLDGEGPFTEVSPARK